MAYNGNTFSSIIIIIIIIEFNIRIQTKNKETITETRLLDLNSPSSELGRILWEFL